MAGATEWPKIKVCSIANAQFERKTRNESHPGFQKLIPAKHVGKFVAAPHGRFHDIHPQHGLQQAARPLVFGEERNNVWIEVANDDASRPDLLCIVIDPQGCL
jgi:hypothetical protein